MWIYVHYFNQFFRTTLTVFFIKDTHLTKLYNDYSIIHDLWISWEMHMELNLICIHSASFFWAVRGCNLYRPPRNAMGLPETPPRDIPWAPEPQKYDPKSLGKNWKLEPILLRAKKQKRLVEIGWLILKSLVRVSWNHLQNGYCRLVSEDSQTQNPSFAKKNNNSWNWTCLGGLNKLGCPFKLVCLNDPLNVPWILMGI